MLAAGRLRAGAYYEALASILGLPYLDEIPPRSVVVTPHVDAVLQRPRWLRIEIDGCARQVVAPTAAGLRDLARLLRERPSVRERLVVSAPGAIRRAVWACRAEERAAETVRGLFERSESQSARIVMTGSQGFLLGILVASVLLAAVCVPEGLLCLVHPLLSAAFFACVGLRIAALVAPRTQSPAADALFEGHERLPVYTVAVALYREADIVGQLVRSLSRLRWPRALLEIKLICESDDHATLAALEALELPPEYEIVRVPPVGPRTKPKALHYALAGARGDLLVIYDAEDRPHPDQLVEAHATFARNDERLAYLQAPLIVSNAGRSPISAVFSLEYAGLFRRLLPFLARTGLPLPLGGTSNHFRVKALRECGAWDPHNVTEDADLGMRLYRSGYRGGVIERYTLEAAPERAGVWRRQRTRWFKGWMQTWLVMMREPRRLWRDMGPMGFIGFQVLIGGMLLSALGHPLLLVFVGRTVLMLFFGGHMPVSAFHRLLFGIDIWNFIGGYLAFVLLARCSMVAEERRRVGRRWIWVPLYWVGMSIAAWLALAELVRDPFYWAKTPHGDGKSDGVMIQPAVCTTADQAEPA